MLVIQTVDEIPLGKLPDSIILDDHLYGFSSLGENEVLRTLNNRAIEYNSCITIQYHQILEDVIVSKYPNLNIQFNIAQHLEKNLTYFTNYCIHPPQTHRNFLCSFNGSDHVSRKLLVAILKRFGYFNPACCSKNFRFTVDKLDGHLKDYVGDRDRLYRKFFIENNSETFFNSINSFGHIRYDHSNNIYNLEEALTNSFLHLVSESLATSYVPFVSEKFLYSIVTRGLFLTYAQPGWHAYLEKYYGFKKYNKLFDYRFDTIQNPVERLVELITMVSKYSKMSSLDWHDLYQLEIDTIEYNYAHYYSGAYIEELEKYNGCITQ